MTQLETLLLALDIWAAWVPDRIKALRRFHGLSGDSFGQQLGSSTPGGARTLTSRLESGDKHPTFAQAIELTRLEETGK